MSGTSISTSTGFVIRNKNVLSVHESLKGLLKPLSTSKYQTRVYQEISMSFMLISLISERIIVSGQASMVDLLGDKDDALSTISWAQVHQLWGYLMSPSPFMSDEILERLGIFIRVSTDAYPIGTNLCSVRIHLRVGTKSPIARNPDIFHWPSSSVFDSNIFSNVEKQDMILGAISSYYSGMSLEAYNPWVELKNFQLHSGSLDVEEIVHTAYPMLEDAKRCWPYLFNYKCQDSAREFEEMLTRELRDMFLGPQAWDDCRVEELIQKAGSDFPSEIHQNHFHNGGSANPDHIRDACIYYRGCWKCQNIKFRQSDQLRKDLKTIVRKRETGQLPPFGDIISVLMKILGSDLSIPSFISRLFFP